MDADGGVVTQTKAKSIFEKYLGESLVKGKKLKEAIEAKEAKVYAGNLRKNKDLLPAPFPPRVDVYHELSLKRTIIEVQASDRLGLLYRLARLIYSMGFDISFARIATERGVAMDTFYIEKGQHSEQVDADNLLELRQGLDVIINQSE
jgi:[protein-PII] uridylyltransferase